MSVFDKAVEVAGAIVFFSAVFILVMIGVFAALALPFLGVMLAFVNPWVGVPVTVALSLLSLSLMTLIAYFVIDEVRGA